MTAIICGPSIYEYEGWTFEFSMASGPWPHRKDGELYRRVPEQFWNTFSRWSVLPKKEREACRIGGGRE